jgi:hypothetical protein
MIHNVAFTKPHIESELQTNFPFKKANDQQKKAR